MEKNISDKTEKNTTVSDPSFVYKYTSFDDFKPINKRFNLPTITNGQLWLSKLNTLNDPLEFGFYLSKDCDQTHLYDFQDWLMSRWACLSLSTSKKNHRLWNYYSDGMKGLVLEYRPAAIKKALSEYDITTIKVDKKYINPNAKSRKIAFCGYVNYGGDKIDLTETYKAYLSKMFNATFSEPLSPEFIDASALFKKNQSWEDESEYRFIVQSDILQDTSSSYCKLLNVMPTSITVGYKIENHNLTAIQEYCENNAIELSMYRPDFFSPNSQQYKLQKLFVPEETVIM